MIKNFKFIDLFSGIGGFHQALTKLGGVCVFASEIDKFCTATYEKNYGINSNVNIRDVSEDLIPEHDVLCAGFPCQAFSKAGKQKGLEDKIRGTLFFEIVRILKFHHTPYLILENVKNLITHDKGNTWNIIQESLRNLGYRTTPDPLILSPHYFGIPQIRERVIILGKYDPKNIGKPLILNFGNFITKEKNSIYDIIDSNPVDSSYYISKYENYILEAWNEFYQGINLKVIGFPVWADFFKYNSTFSNLPDWKANVIKKNIKLYSENKEFIDNWLNKYHNLKDFVHTHRKFEWQCGTSISSIWEGVIQFRPSGIRVKLPNAFQTLVAMVQIPIIGRYKRRLTINEVAKLQSFPTETDLVPFYPDPNRQQAYKQFGNSVNVEVIRRAAEALLNYQDLTV